MALPAQNIGAVVLAAGQSRRMGTPKMVLPWGRWTVIEQVIHTLDDAGIRDIVVVTGGAKTEIENALQNSPVKLIHNPRAMDSEMLVSLKYGIMASAPTCEALMVVLGDQPTIEVGVVRAVVEQFTNRRSTIVVPSYQMRRGHPWLVDRSLWAELLEQPEEETLRDFLNAHSENIDYVEVQSDSVLKDLDTPTDYNISKPK